MSLVPYIRVVKTIWFYKLFRPSTVAGQQLNRVRTVYIKPRHEGLDGVGAVGGGGVWNSLISKNLAHYSLSLKFLLIL